MDDERHLINVEMDQEELARQFERYNLLSAPVVDDDNRLVGVVTVDDIVEVMAEEAQEDIFLLAGVGDESLADTVLRTALGRFSPGCLSISSRRLSPLMSSACSMQPLSRWWRWPF